MRSYGRLRAVDAGVSADGVLTALVIANPAKYADAPQRAAVFAQVAERVAAVPGVRAVGLCDCMPPDQVRQGGGVLLDDGERDGAWPNVEQTRADPGYFAALRVPILAGRGFAPSDREGAPRVAVVNETFARTLLNASDRLDRALGRRITMDGDNWMTVVGVARDVHYAGLAAAVEPAMYSAFAQDAFPGMNLFVRVGCADEGRCDAARVAPAVQRALLAVDPEIPLAEVRTLEAGLAESIASPRFQTTLLTIFGGVALALAIVGVYGVVAYGVTQRRRELGVRVALGAGRGSVMRHVVWGALRPVAAGAALGVGAAVIGAQAVTRFVYATDVHEPGVYAAVAAVLFAVAAAAAYLPARRAARVDPVLTLRGD